MTIADYRNYYWDDDLDSHMIGDNNPSNYPTNNPNNNNVVIPFNMLTIVLNYPQVSTMLWVAKYTTPK